VRHRPDSFSGRRGLWPEEVQQIEDFYRRQGLVIAEWNTLGYPTLPGLTVADKDVPTGLANVPKGLAFLRDQELAQRQSQLRQARAVGNVQWQKTMEEQIIQTRQTMDRIKQDLKDLRKQQAKRASYRAQLAAQRRLEELLHVHYLGWYGRFVARFEDEEEFDHRLWKNLAHLVKAKFPHGKLSGPGFVFYHDGAPHKVINPNPPHELQPNPAAEPIVITQDELGEGRIAQVAAIHRSGKLRDDPLLRDVAEQTPYHYWFDVVKAADASRVLAWYKLQIKKSAADRLRSKGFPAHYLQEAKVPGQVEIVFPAAVAYREGNKPDGELRSFYFAGDTAEYWLAPKISEIIPATGGIAYFLGHRVGPFPMQTYWNYYQPVLHNIIHETNRIRYKD
ncbi:MAG: hypothetical protein M3347_10875, partial [Armatimonadota bacterium]|nr:hypothetical protein [Armatimonadota bacterium]